MRISVSVCDNCGAEVGRTDAANGDGRTKTARRMKEQQVAKIAGQKFDLCGDCAGAKPRDLTSAPVAEWPRYVRREDVQRFLAKQ